MPHAHCSYNVFVHSVIDDLWLFLLRHIFYLSINFYDLLLLLVYLAHTFNFEDITDYSRGLKSVCKFKICKKYAKILHRRKFLLCILQLFCNFFTVFLQFFCNFFANFLQFFCNFFAKFL